MGVESSEKLMKELADPSPRLGLPQPKWPIIYYTHSTVNKKIKGKDLMNNFEALVSKIEQIAKNKPHIIVINNFENT